MSSLSRRVLSLKLPASVLVKMSDRLLEICKQCGTIYQYTLDLARDQLLVEVEEFSALRLLNKFKNTSRKLGGYAVRVVSTTRQEMMRAQAESHETAPQRMPAEKPPKMNEFNPSLLCADDGVTSAVLYAHVDKETAEVKHDVLRQAFAKYGRVVCLASFRYKGTLYCLVQYPDGANATEGLRKLNGMYIYDDCCILRVCYSNAPDLVFRDDARGFKKLLHHQVQLSGKTVENLQVWNPNKGGAAEQNRTKEVTRKVGHIKVKGNVPIDKIPRIPKLSAINNNDDISRQLQAHNLQDNSDTGRSTSAAAKSKTSKPNQSTSRDSRQPSHMSKDSYHKFSYTPIKPKIPPTIKQKTTTSSGQALTSTSKKLPSPVSGHDNSQQQDECIGTKTVELTSGSSSSSNNVSSNDRISTADSSSTLDATSNSLKIASPSSSSTDKVSSNDRINTVDKSTFLDVTAFTLSLDPSDCSDIDTDASASSASDSRRLANLGDQPPLVSCHSVEIAVGCQDIIQSSVAVQCSIEDDELQRMVMSSHEQLDELKKKSADISEKENRNKELLLENANLKKLLNEVQNEMRQLKEIIGTVAKRQDAATQVDPEPDGITVQQDEVQQSPVVQQTDKQTDSPGTSSRSLQKRSSSTIDDDQTYEPSKKKRKRKKIKPSSSSLMGSPENNIEKTNGYAIKIRKKFLHTHLQSFLKSQKFIKNKLDTMKEAMKSCSADLHISMSRIVPQFESIYDSTVMLANLEQSNNEDELFLCITELSTLFPSLIADLNESLSLKLPGVSLTILSVLKKMEYLANEMKKYSPQSKTLAYGNANTGEATLVESSFSSDHDTITNPSTPPPLLSLDEAVEMFDDNQLPQQSSNDNSLDCVTSLTVCISTKFLRKIGGKRLFTDENISTDETQNGSPNDSIPTVDPSEVEEQSAASPESLHVDTVTVPSPVSNEPVDIVVENEYHVTKPVEAAGETVSKENYRTAAIDGSNNATGSLDDSVKSTVLDSNNSNNVVTDSTAPTSPSACTEAPPTTSISQSTAATSTCSTNQNIVNIAESLPPFNTIPSNQSCATTVMPIHSSTPPPYTASARLYDQPHLPTGGFTPLLPPYIPTPIINISKSMDGLVVKWTLEQIDIHLASQIHSYSLCVFQGHHAPTPDLWHIIGEVQAMKLPMSCTLKCLQKGTIYHFAVQAICRDGMRGQFSQSKIIQIY